MGKVDRWEQVGIWEEVRRWKKGEMIWELPTSCLSVRPSTAPIPIAIAIAESKPISRSEPPAIPTESTTSKPIELVELTIIIVVIASAESTTALSVEVLRLDDEGRGGYCQSESRDVHFWGPNRVWIGKRPALLREGRVCEREESAWLFVEAERNDKDQPRARKYTVSACASEDSKNCSQSPWEKRRKL